MTKLALRPSRKRLSYFEIYEAIRKLEVGDELVLNNSKHVRTYVYRAAKELHLNLYTQPTTTKDTLYLMRMSRPDDVAVELLGQDFLYYSPEKREMLPRFVAEQGYEVTKALLDTGILIRVYDHPLLASGYTHKAIFNSDGTFNNEAWEAAQAAYDAVMKD